MNSLSQGSSNFSLGGTSNPQSIVGNNGVLSQNTNNIQTGLNQNILNSNANNINLSVNSLNSPKNSQVLTSKNSRPLVVINQPPLPTVDFYLGSSIILICLLLIIMIVFKSKKNYNLLLKNK